MASGADPVLAQNLGDPGGSDLGSARGAPAVTWPEAVPLAFLVKQLVGALAGLVWVGEAAAWTAGEEDLAAAVVEAFLLASMLGQLVQQTGLLCHCYPVVAVEEGSVNVKVNFI